MIRLIVNIIIFAGLVYGGFWLWNNNPTVRNFVQDKLETGKFLTLEEQFSSEQIMAANEQELLKDESYTFLEPDLIFYPYLLMEVKYVASGDKTGEGMLLWGLDNGEMVIDATTWERSHGFEDAINSGASRNDFKLLNIIAKNRGTVTRETLANTLNIEGAILDSWLDAARKKQLIIRSGDGYRIHLNKPRLNVDPITKINTWLVTKPFKGVNKMPRQYSKSQVENVCKAAFAIRNVSEVFLPVYIIRVMNPDGSVFTTYWNALNGKRIIDVF